MIKNHVKLTITGAAGQIGYALLFRIAAGEMFGPQTSVELNLLELPQALPALEGIAMELTDCAFPLLKGINCTADLDQAFSGVNWSLLVGSVPRKAGMERKDLLEVNGKLFVEQGKAIANNAAQDVKVLVVGNPCNTNALIAMHHAKGVPNDRFYAMTMLDEKRARAQLALKAGVAIDAVTQMSIWGNHSATQFPDYQHAKINGKLATEVIGDDDWLKNDFIPTVQQRGAAVIKARGSSSAASAANAIISNVYQLTYETKADESFSTALCSNGQYDVDPELIFSFPCRNIGGKVSVVEGLGFDEFGRDKLTETLTELRQEKSVVQSLGLLN